jgi:hypothetical protein
MAADERVVWVDERREKEGCLVAEVQAEAQLT